MNFVGSRPVDTLLVRPLFCGLAPTETSLSVCLIAVASQVPRFIELPALPTWMFPPTNLVESRVDRSTPLITDG